ncbi:ferrochelatase [Moraxella macacae]|nr:ferrochelatase [Moraxella macacae]
MKPTTAQKIAVILVNLGTPDEPTVTAVRQYLRQFLSDGRVIEIPKLLWQIILNLFVLTTRPKKVAHAYKSIWDSDSPLRKIAFEQADALQQRFDNRDNHDNHDNHDLLEKLDVQVCVAMTYGNPSLQDLLTKLNQQQVENTVILPLYPQYSATTTAAVFDVVAKWGLSQRDLPAISFIKDYFDNPLYIKALAEKIRDFQALHGKPEKLLMSFHGIPKPYEDKGDPYAKRCRYTASQLAKALKLADDEWLCSFQSRFGKQEWVKPYTDAILTDWGRQGVKSVHVISPAFSADCLETLEELAVENRDIFQSNGGGEYRYIPALNADKLHIDLIYSIVLPHVLAHAKF